MSKSGRASVWICEDVSLNGTKVIEGCGFLGFYKPESKADRTPRRCPSCGQSATYNRTGDIALVAIETKNVSAPKITEVKEPSA